LPERLTLTTAEKAIGEERHIAAEAMLENEELNKHMRALEQS
jgi:hypothetical protein